MHPDAAVACPITDTGTGTGTGTGTDPRTHPHDNRPADRVETRSAGLPWSSGSCYQPQASPSRRPSVRSSEAISGARALRTVVTSAGSGRTAARSMGR